LSSHLEADAAVNSSIRPKTMPVWAAALPVPQRDTPLAGRLISKNYLGAGGDQQLQSGSASITLRGTACSAHADDMAKPCNALMASPGWPRACRRPDLDVLGDRPDHSASFIATSGNRREWLREPWLSLRCARFVVRAAPLGKESQGKRGPARELDAVLGAPAGGPAI